MRAKSGEAAKERKDFMDYVGLKEVARWRSKDFLMKLRPRRKINYCELSPSHNDFATEKSILLEELMAINGQLRKYLQWFQSYAASNRVDETTCTTFDQFIKKLRKYKLKLLGSCYKPKQFYKQLFLDTDLAQTFAANVQKYSSFIKEHYREIDTPFSHPSPELAERIQTNLEHEAASFTLVISNLQQKNKQIESSLITRYKKIDLPDFNNNENLKHFKKRLLVRLDLDRLGMGDKSKASKGWRRRIFPYKYHNGMELYKLGRKEDATQKTRQVIRRLKSERNLKLYVKIQRSAYEEFISTGQYYINLFKSSLEIFRRYYLSHLKTNRKRLFAQLNVLDSANFQHRHFINSLICYSACSQNWTEPRKEDLIKRGVDIANALFGTKKSYLDVVTLCFYPVNRKDKIKKYISSSSFKFKEKENYWNYFGKLLKIGENVDSCEGKLIREGFCRSIGSTNVEENSRNYRQVLSLKNANLSENLEIFRGKFGGSNEDVILRKAEIEGNNSKLKERLLLESDSIPFGTLTSRNEANNQIGQISRSKEIVDGEMKIREISVIPDEDSDLGNNSVFCRNGRNLTARSAISNDSPNRKQIGQISCLNETLTRTWRIPELSIIPSENMKLENETNGGNCSTRRDPASFPIREVSRSNGRGSRNVNQLSIIPLENLKPNLISLGNGQYSTAGSEALSFPIGNLTGQIPRSNQTVSRSTEICQLSVIPNDDLKDDSICLGRKETSNGRSKAGSLPIGNQIGQIPRSNQIESRSTEIRQLSVIPNDDLKDDSICLGRRETSTGISKAGSLPIGTQIGQIPRSIQTVSGSSEIQELPVILNDNLKDDSICLGRRDTSNGRSKVGSLTIGTQIEQIPSSNQTGTRSREIQEISVKIYDDFKDDSICLGRRETSNGRSNAGSLPIGTQIEQIPRSNQTVSRLTEICKLSIIPNDDLKDDSICLGTRDTSTGRSNAGSLPIGTQIGQIPSSNQTGTRSREIQEISVKLNDDFKDDSICFGRRETSNGRSNAGSLPIGTQIEQIPRSNQIITGSKETQELSVILNDDIKDDAICFGRRETSTGRSDNGSLPIGTQIEQIPRSNQTVSRSTEFRKLSVIPNDDLKDDSICLGRRETSTGRSNAGSLPIGTQIEQIPRSNQIITGSKETQELSVILNDDIKDDVICFGRRETSTGRSDNGSLPIGTQIEQIPRSNQTVSRSTEFRKLSVIPNDDLKDDSICFGRRETSTGRSNAGSLPIGTQIGQIPRTNQTVTGSREIQDLSVILNDDLKDDSICLGRRETSTGRSNAGSLPIGNQIGQIPRSIQTVSGSRQIQELSVILEDDLKDDSICFGRRRTSTGRSNAESLPIGTQIRQIPKSNQTVSESRKIQELSVILNDDLKDDAICFGRRGTSTGRSNAGSLSIGNQIGQNPRSNQTVTGSRETQELSVILKDDLKDDSICLGRRETSTGKSNAGSLSIGTQIGQIPRSNQTVSGSREIQELSVILNDDLKHDSICFGRRGISTGRSNAESLPIGTQIEQIPRSTQTVTGSKEIQELSVILNDDLKDDAICFGRRETSTGRSNTGSLPIGTQIEQIPRSNQTVSRSTEIRKLSVIPNDDLKDDSICLGRRDISTGRSSAGSLPIGTQIGQIPISIQTGTRSRETQEISVILNDDLKDDSLYPGRRETSTGRRKAGSLPIGTQIGQFPRSNQTVSRSREIEELSDILNDDLKDDSICLGRRENEKSSGRSNAGSFPIGKKIGQISKSNEIDELTITPNLKSDSVSFQNGNSSAAIGLTNGNQNRQIEQISKSNESVSGSKKIHGLSIVPIDQLKPKNDSTCFGNGQTRPARNEAASFPTGNQIGQTPRSNETGARKSHGISVIPIENLKSKKDRNGENSIARNDAIETLSESKKVQGLSIIPIEKLKNDSVCFTNGGNQRLSLAFDNQIGQGLRSDESGKDSRKNRGLSIIPIENLKLMNGSNSFGNEDNRCTRNEAGSFPIGNHIGQISRSNECLSETNKMYKMSDIPHYQIGETLKEDESANSHQIEKGNEARNKAGSFPIGNQIVHISRSNEGLNESNKMHKMSVIPHYQIGEALKENESANSNQIEKGNDARNKAGSFPIGNQIGHISRSNESLNESNKMHKMSHYQIGQTLKENECANSHQIEKGNEARNIAGSFPIGNHIGLMSRSNESLNESNKMLKMSVIPHYQIGQALKEDESANSHQIEKGNEARNKAGSFPIGNHIGQIPRSNESLNESNKMLKMYVMPHYQIGQTLKEDKSANSHQIEEGNEARNKAGSFLIKNQIGQISRSNESLNESNKMLKMSVIPHYQIGQALKENEYANSQQIEKGNDARNKAGSFQIGNQIGHISRSNESLNESNKMHKMSHYEIGQTLKENECANSHQIEKGNDARNKAGSFPIGNQIGHISRSNESLNESNKMLKMSVIPHYQIGQALKEDESENSHQIEKGNDARNKAGSFPIGNQIGHISRSNESLNESNKMHKMSVIPHYQIGQTLKENECANSHQIEKGNEARIIAGSFPIGNQIGHILRSNESLNESNKMLKMSVIPHYQIGQALKEDESANSHQIEKGNDARNIAGSFPIGNQIGQIPRSNESLNESNKMHKMSHYEIGQTLKENECANSHQIEKGNDARNKAGSFPIGNQIGHISRSNESLNESNKMLKMSVIPHYQIGQALKEDESENSHQIEKGNDARNKAGSFPIGNQIGHISRSNESLNESNKMYKMSHYQIGQTLKENESANSHQIEKGNDARNKAGSFPIGNQIGHISRSNESLNESNKMHKMSVIPHYQIGQALKEDESANSHQIEKGNDARNKAASFPIGNQIGHISRSNESLNESNKMHKMSVIPHYQIGQTLKENESANAHQIEKGNESGNIAGSFPIGNQIGHISRSNESLNESNKMHKMSVIPHYQIGQTLKEDECANSHQIEKGNEARNKAGSFAIGNQIGQIPRSNETLNESNKMLTISVTPHYQIGQILKQNEAANSNQIEKENEPISNETVNPKKQSGSLRTLYRNFGREIAADENVKSKRADETETLCFPKKLDIEEKQSDRFVEIFESKNKTRVKVPDLRIVKSNDFRKVDVLKIKPPEINFGNSIGSSNVPKQVELHRNCCENNARIYSPTKARRNIFDVDCCKIKPNPQPQDVNKPKTKRLSTFDLEENLETDYKLNILRELTVDFNKTLEYYFAQQSAPSQPKQTKFQNPQNPQNYEDQMFNSPVNKFPYKSNIRTEIYRTNQVLSKIYEFYFDSPTLVNLNSEILQLYNYPEHRVVLSWMNHATSIIRPKFGNCFPFISHVSTMQGLVYVEHQSLQEESLSSPYVIALAPAVTQVILELLTNPHSQLQESLTLTIAISPETSPSQIACYTQFIFSYLHNYKHRYTVLGRNPSVNPKKKRKKSANRVKVLSNIRISPGKRKCEDLVFNNENYSRDLLELLKNSEETGRESCKLSAKKFGSFLYWDAEDGMLINCDFSKDTKKDSVGRKSDDLPTYEEHMMGNYLRRREKIFEDNQMLRANLENQNNNDSEIQTNFGQEIVLQNSVQNLNAFPQTIHLPEHLDNIPNQLPINCRDMTQNLELTQILKIAEIRDIIGPSNSMISTQDLTDIIDKIEAFIDEWLAVKKSKLKEAVKTPSPNKSNNRRKSKSPKKIVVEDSFQTKLTNIANAVIDILTNADAVRRDTADVNASKICDFMQQSYDSICNFETVDAQNGNVAIDGSQLQNLNTKLLEKVLECFRKPKTSEDELDDEFVLGGKMQLISNKITSEENEGKLVDESGLSGKMRLICNKKTSEEHEGKLVEETGLSGKMQLACNKQTSAENEGKLVEESGLSGKMQLICNKKTSEEHEGKLVEETGLSSKMHLACNKKTSVENEEKLLEESDLSGKMQLNCNKQAFEENEGKLVEESGLSNKMQLICKKNVKEATHRKVKACRKVSIEDVIARCNKKLLNSGMVQKETGEEIAGDKNTNLTVLQQGEKNLCGRRNVRKKPWTVSSNENQKNPEQTVLGEVKIGESKSLEVSSKDLAEALPRDIKEDNPCEARQMHLSNNFKEISKSIGKGKKNLCKRRNLRKKSRTVSSNSNQTISEQTVLGEVKTGESKSLEAASKVHAEALSMDSKEDNPCKAKQMHLSNNFKEISKSIGKGKKNPCKRRNLPKKSRRVSSNKNQTISEQTVLGEVKTDESKSLGDCSKVHGEALPMDIKEDNPCDAKQMHLSNNFEDISKSIAKGIRTLCKRRNLRKKTRTVSSNKDQTISEQRVLGEVKTSESKSLEVSSKDFTETLPIDIKEENPCEGKKMHVSNNFDEILKSIKKEKKNLCKTRNLRKKSWTVSSNRNQTISEHTVLGEVKSGKSKSLEDSSKVFAETLAMDIQEDTLCAAKQKHLSNKFEDISRSIRKEKKNLCKRRNLRKKSSTVSSNKNQIIWEQTVLGEVKTGESKTLEVSSKVFAKTLPIIKMDFQEDNPCEMEQIHSSNCFEDISKSIGHSILGLNEHAEEIFSAEDPIIEEIVYTVDFPDNVILIEGCTLETLNENIIFVEESKEGKGELEAEFVRDPSGVEENSSEELKTFGLEGEKLKDLRAEIVFRTEEGVHGPSGDENDSSEEFKKNGLEGDTLKDLRAEIVFEEQLKGQEENCNKIAKSFKSREAIDVNMEEVKSEVAICEITLEEKLVAMEENCRKIARNHNSREGIDGFNKIDLLKEQSATLIPQIDFEGKLEMQEDKVADSLREEIDEFAFVKLKEEGSKLAEIMLEGKSAIEVETCYKSNHLKDKTNKFNLKEQQTEASISERVFEENRASPRAEVVEFKVDLEEEQLDEAYISKKLEMKEENRKKIPRNYNSREEIEDFNISDIYDTEMTMQFDDLKPFSSIPNLSNIKDNLGIDEIVLDFFMEHSDDLMVSTEATNATSFTLLQESSKSMDLQMDYEEAISDDSNDMQSTIDITDNVYELEDSIVQINLDKYYLIYNQCKYGLNREYLDVVCEKLTKPECVYMTCNKQKRLDYHAEELANFVSCGISSEQISINVSLCVYFLVVCIKCGIDLVPDLQNYATNVLDVEGYKKELALLEQCVVPDIVKDFYEFINFYNYDRGMELISFEYFVDNLWNGNLLDYYFGFLHYAKLGGICK